MANNQNLRPFNTMTAEERREISRKGGKASGAARRAKREAVNAEKARIRAEREIAGEEIALLAASAKALLRMQTNGI